MFRNEAADRFWTFKGLLDGLLIARFYGPAFMPLRHKITNEIFSLYCNFMFEEAFPMVLC